jgi:hypothetical protein
MGVSSAATLHPSTETQAEPGKVRAEQTPTFPPSGNPSPAEINRQQNSPAAADRGQDEVKLHWQPPGETVVYQFVNQQGTLIEQVPSKQELNLAREISQELAQEAATEKPAGVEGGKDNGH